jgi:hypothetical protein
MPAMARFWAVKLPRFAPVGKEGVERGETARFPPSLGGLSDPKPGVDNQATSVAYAEGGGNAPSRTPREGNVVPSRGLSPRLGRAFGWSWG